MMRNAQRRPKWPSFLPIIPIVVMLAARFLSAQKAGKAPSSQPGSPRFAVLVQSAKLGVKAITVSDLAERLNVNRKPLYLIDVREDGEWSAGHIPHALHLSKGIIERDIEQNVANPSAELVLYCGSGARSALAAENLQRMGYTRVFNLDGGLRAWIDAGNPVVKD